MGYSSSAMASRGIRSLLGAATMLRMLQTAPVARPGPLAYRAATLPVLVRRAYTAPVDGPATPGGPASSPLRDRLREDLKAAMRSKDKERTTVIRSILSAITYADKATGVEVDDERARQELRRMVKKHEESIQQFAQAGRADLTEREQAQLSIVQAYLPQAKSEAELAAAVDAAIQRAGAKGPGDLGAVMKEATKTLSADEAPRKVLADLIKARLNSLPRS